MILIGGGVIAISIFGYFAISFFMYLICDEEDEEKYKEEATALASRLEELNAEIEQLKKQSSPTPETK